MNEIEKSVEAGLRYLDGSDYNMQDIEIAMRKVANKMAKFTFEDLMPFRPEGNRRLFVSREEYDYFRKKYVEVTK